MPDAAFEKLAALVGTWDQVFQCAVFLVAVVALAAVATHAVTALGRAFDSKKGREFNSDSKPMRRNLRSTRG